MRLGQPSVKAEEKVLEKPDENDPAFQLQRYDFAAIRQKSEVIEMKRENIRAPDKEEYDLIGVNEVPPIKMTPE